jgi:GH24 family phage-related lysozyme (muramidase)
MANNIVPQMMQILRRWETFVAKSYKDTDGTYHVGYGSGNATGHWKIDENTVLKDEAEALRMLETDVNDHYSPQLDKILELEGVEVNDFEYSALLDILYNRGQRRLRNSAALNWLKRPTEKNYRAEACRAIVFSHVDGFEPLDVAADRVTGIDRVYLGLTLRRIDDAHLFQTKP